MSNPHAYQHQMGEAIHRLMSLGASPEARIAGAVVAFFNAFAHDRLPSGGALQWWNKAQQVIGHDWTPARARALTNLQRHELVLFLWELDRAVSRDYYRFEYTGREA